MATVSWLDPPVSWLLGSEFTRAVDAPSAPPKISAGMADNVLYYGDNLDVLRRHIKDETVDLVYLDPPFNSQQDYNVLFEEHGQRAAAQIRAFEDSWTWDDAAARAYAEVAEAGPDQVSKTLQALRTALGDTDMLAYLSMMAPRLVALRRVLNASGS